MIPGPEAFRIQFVLLDQVPTSETNEQCFNILLVGWLGRPSSNGEESQQGKLYTIEELGGFLGIPVNLKETDAFHLTIEEYLHSLISLIDELVRQMLYSNGTMALNLTGSTCSQLGDVRRLRTTCSDCPIHQGCPCGISDPESQE